MRNRLLGAGQPDPHIWRIRTVDFGPVQVATECLFTVPGPLARGRRTPRVAVVFDDGEITITEGW